MTGYLLTGREALAHWRVWTLLTYSLVEMTPFWGALNILFLWIIGRMVEGELPRTAVFDAVRGVRADGGGGVAAAALGDAGGRADGRGASVLVMGLMAYWCFTAPDEPLEMRLFFMIPITVRPQVFFWFFLALDFAGFGTFELPRVLGWRSVRGAWIIRRIWGQCSRGGFARGGSSGCWRGRRLGRCRWPKRRRGGGCKRRCRWGRGRERGGARRRAAARAGKPAIGNRREMREEVDRILDKINVEGFGALSAEERQTLDEAKAWLGK